MNRIEILKSIVQRRGQELIQKNDPYRSRFTGDDDLSSSVRGNVNVKENFTTEEFTARRGRPPGSRGSSQTCSKTIPNSARRNGTLPEVKKDATVATGESNMNDVKKLEQYPDTMPNDSSKLARVGKLNVSEMKQELWQTLVDMKAGKIDVHVAREFSVGCNTIAKFIRLEIDAHNALK